MPKFKIGQVAVWVHPNSELFKMIGCVCDQSLENSLGKIRRHEPWLYNAALACGFYLGAKRRFRIIYLYDETEYAPNTNQRQANLKQALCRLLAATIRYQATFDELVKKIDQYLEVTYVRRSEDSSLINDSLNVDPDNVVSVHAPLYMQPF